jgi:hypothetical protein
MISFNQENIVEEHTFAMPSLKALSFEPHVWSIKKTRNMYLIKMSCNCSLYIPARDLSIYHTIGYESHPEHSCNRSPLFPYSITLMTKYKLSKPTYYVSSEIRPIDPDINCLNPYEAYQKNRVLFRQNIKLGRQALYLYEANARDNTSDSDSEEEYENEMREFNEEIHENNSLIFFYDKIDSDCRSGDIQKYENMDEHDF